METLRNCRARLWVRILAPHPVYRCSWVLSLVLVALLAVAVAESAVGIDIGYLVRDDVTAYDLVSAELESSDVVPYVTTDYYSPFGRRFGWDSNTQMVTSIQGLPNNLWTQFTDADKGLAGVLLEMMVRAEQAVDEVPSTVIGSLDEWENQTIEAYSVLDGKSYIRLPVADILAMITQNQRAYSSLKNGVVDYYLWNPSNTKTFNNLGIGDLLALDSQSRSTIYAALFRAFRSEVYSLSSMREDSVVTRDFVGMFRVLTENQYLSDVHLKSWLTAGNNYGSYLYGDGQEYPTPSGLTLTSLTIEGFKGLAQLLAGNSGTRTIDITYLNPENILGDGVTYKYPSLFNALGNWATEQLASLSKLQFVLANDSDIRLKQDEKENQDAVENQFFGDGQAAVKPSDISGAAGLTSSAKDIFGGAGSAGDAFTAASDDGNYWFFSQEVAEDLDAVNSVSTIQEEDDSWLDDYIVDENGFLTLKDPSFFDVDAYLGR